MKESLYMPQGIKKQREYYSGFGKRELRYTVFSIIAAIGIAVFLYMVLHKNVFAVLMLLIIPSTTALFVIRDETNNIAVIDQVRFMLSFSKEQKKYPYRTRNELDV